MRAENTAPVGTISRSKFPLMRKQTAPLYQDTEICFRTQERLAIRSKSSLISGKYSIIKLFRRLSVKAKVEGYKAIVVNINATVLII